MKMIRTIALPLFCGMLLGTSLSAGDLSRYREFQLGTDLATLAKQTRLDPSLVKVVQQRPELIQELVWQPPAFGPSSLAEVVREVSFTFYNGALFQIAVSYDPYRTEGMNPYDLIKAISTSYGTASRPGVAVKTPQAYGDTEEILATWEDTEYSIKLVLRSYGPSFALVAVQNKLDALARASSLIATRLDAAEAPEREAARIQAKADPEHSKEEKARLKNKANFRP